MADALTPQFNNVERITKITVKIKGIVVGAIRDLSPSERRNITAHFTLGGSNPEEPKVMVPGLVTDKSLRVSYLALWKKNVMTALANPDLSVNSGRLIGTLVEQREPFTIEVVRTNPGSTTEAVVTRYEDCFISDYSADYDITKGDVAVIESCTVVYRRAITE